MNCQTNAKTRNTLQATQVLSQFKSELTTLAAAHGIDWSQLTSAIRFDTKAEPSYALPLNSAVNPAYRGNTFVEVSQRVNKDGNRYPIVQFKTFAYGETVETWDGQQAWQTRDINELSKQNLPVKLIISARLKNKLTTATTQCR